MFLPTPREVYEDLVAGRFAQATYTALESLFRPALSFEATRALREKRFYDAICILDREMGMLGNKARAALADCRWGFA